MHKTPPPARRVKDSKNQLSFWVDTEVYDKDEYDRLKDWMKQNINTVDRFTPKWPEEEAEDQSLWGYVGLRSFDDGPIKLRFGFRYEEDAMAFKLVVNTHEGNS